MEVGRNKRCSHMDQSLMCQETGTTSWARDEQVRATATRQEPSPEQAITPPTPTNTLICWTYLAAGTSSPARLQHHRPCAIHPDSTQCTIPTTITNSPSTLLIWSHLPTSTTTMALHSNDLLSTPQEPCPTRITLDLCLVTTLRVGPTSLQPSSHSNCRGLAM